MRRKVSDKRVLGLIGRYLRAGLMAGGGNVPRGRGRSVAKVIEEATPTLRGWITYFRKLGLTPMIETLNRLQRTS